MAKVRTSAVRKYKLLSAILLLTAVALVFYILSPEFFYKAPMDFFLPEFSTQDFTRIENVDVGIKDDVGVVLLKAECYELTATVEPLQAISINNGLSNVVEARPNTHDLAKDVFETLGVEVVMVKITNVKDNSYYAKILLRQNNKYLNFDVRPSDGVAIALRMNSSIYINSTLLKEMGNKVC
jgi:hypothetical protein